MVQPLFCSVKSPPSLFDRLRQAVASTKTQLVGRLEEIAEVNPTVNESLLEELEAALLEADLGVKTTREILIHIRDQVRKHQLRESSELTGAVEREILGILEEPFQSRSQPTPEGERKKGISQPEVIFLVGVNGVGKTTSVAKLAHAYQAQGRQPLLAAADTFRAAAVEQLEIWADRLGVKIVKLKPGADPSAVVFDALTSARRQGYDPVIVDTAGRLHTKYNLMRELAKMCRIAGREVPGAPHQVLLVLDAMTGQNGLAQARQFVDQASATSVVLTKLDGTAKGGVVVAIARELGLPVHFVGIGENLEDLIPFHPSAFVRSLFKTSSLS